MGTENNEPGAQGPVGGTGPVGGNSHPAEQKDIMALKASLEEKDTALKAALKDLDASKVAHAELQNRHLTLEASHKKLGEQLSRIPQLEQEVNAHKTNLEAAQKSGKDAVEASLEYRRQIISMKWGVPLDTLKIKNSEQLTQFEEALKAVKGEPKGPGNFAFGGGPGGNATPLKGIERAKAILAQHGFKD